MKSGYDPDHRRGDTIVALVLVAATLAGLAWVLGAVYGL